MNQTLRPVGLHIGSLIFPGMDQIDFTGPFEVFSRIPNSTYHIIAKEKRPVRDASGLILTPERTFSEVNYLDLLHVPGGPGQEGLMEDEPTLSFIRKRSMNAIYTFSVCTGALVLGAAGLLRGRKATTHWASLHLLKYFGAATVGERVVIDRNLVSTGGVTAGIDGALRVVALLCGEQMAQAIQLAIQYAPEPPFDSGSLDTAPAHIVEMVQAGYQPLTEARLVTAQRVGAKLGLEENELTEEESTTDSEG
ncbi:MAG: DJ-1/PfpI family protein, partial [Verrucomicrobia bacterium]|nr:DJ-1/PfpI family protein [Verrucomicrobiota bacterium]